VDERMTELQVKELEALLREGIELLVRKARSIDKEAVVRFEDEQMEVLREEDKIVLMNQGIDAVLEEFSAYMRSKKESRWDLKLGTFCGLGSLDTGSRSCACWRMPRVCESATEGRWSGWIHLGRWLARAGHWDTPSATA